jgi:MFS family permease
VLLCAAVPTASDLADQAFDSSGGTLARSPAALSAAAPGVLWRWAVLVTVSVTMFGNYYVYDSLGMVADLVKQAYGINDAQYGLLAGAYSIAAVIVLLVGGAIIDRIGCKRAVLYFGGIASAAALLIAMAPNYHVLLAGRFLLGIGCEPLGVAVTTTLVRWFKARELAFALGLNLTLSRLGSVAADRSPEWARFAYDGGFARPLYLGAAIGFLCILGGGLYYGLEHFAERRFRLGAAGSTDKLSLAEIVGFGGSFWVLTGLCISFYAATFSFQSFATKFFIEAHAVPRVQAGVLLSYLPSMAMVATPLLGLLVDRIGHRALGLLLGTLLSAPVYFMMTRSGVPLSYSVALMGITFSLIPAIIWPEVAFLVDEKRLGTAYSLMTLLQQVFVFLVSAALGWVNDLAQASAQNPRGYAPGMWLLTGLSGLAVGFAICFYAMQRAKRAA